MEAAARVCPFCGEPPGAAMFCAACGRNLAAVERLPTRAEWEGGAPARAATAAPSDARPLADRCAEATARFLAAMHAAGDPGTTETPMPQRAFRRTPKVRGWVVRPVERDDDLADPRHYEPGLVLGVDGSWHRLDNEVRGWGQRDFPIFHHTVGPEPVDPPADERLIGELAAVLAEHGVVTPAA